MAYKFTEEERLTYEDIEKANAEIKTLPLGKKNYAEVAERVKAFRKLYPDGLIDTKIEKYEDGLIIVRAEVFGNYENIPHSHMATGHAMEREGTSNINRFNALENCETSAVGRALGFLGLTGGGTIASYEEVENAKLKQEGAKLATTTEKAGLIASANAKGLKHEEILKLVGFDRDKQPEGMTAEQYGKAMKIINEA
jgi:hypothetical protein